MSQIIAIGVASVVEFVIGAIWYMPLFGKAWGEIHGFNQLDKKTQQEMQRQMMPLLVTQFVGTLITTVVLAKAITALPNYSAYVLAGLAWIGFVVPTQIAGVIFGNTKPRWFVKKSAIMASGSLACLLAAALVLTMLG